MTSAVAMSMVGRPSMLAMFDRVHQWPKMMSKVGVAQNLNTLGAGLEGTVAYMQALGVTMFDGACEFDVWYKNPGTVNPCLNATYDGYGRALTMTTTPASPVTDYVAAVNALCIVMGMQLIGPIPEQQQLGTFEPRRHPVPLDITAHCDKVAKWIKGTNWPAPVRWTLWNEFMRTMWDCKQGKNLDGTSFTESDAAYKLRRATLKEAAVTSMVALYLGTFTLSGTKDVGKWSSASPGSMLSGDTRTSNGRTMIDGRTGRQGWIDAVIAQILPASSTTLPTYFTYNDFGNRKSIRDDASDFKGQDWPLQGNQGGPGSLKTSNSDEGGEDQEPAADTRMGPACEMLTMLLCHIERPEVAVQCFSYWLGGQDGFLSNDGLGGYTKRHRYTALELWSKVPTRRCPMTFVQPAPEADGDLYGLQGVLGIAGIDPGGQTASMLVWWERGGTLQLGISTQGLPAPLAATTPTHYALSEASATAVETPLTDSFITIEPRTVHLIRWAVGTSPEDRRQPLADGVRTPGFLRRVDTYKRPKGAGAYLDQVRGLASITPSSSYTGTLATGAAWKNAPDGVWLTLWAHNVDVGANSVTVTCDYGAGAVTLLSTTAGAITPGQIVALDIIGNAPVGWSAGAREADIQIKHTGAATQRIEAWFSGTLAKAQAIAN